jgi:hypothetical protein
MDRLDDAVISADLGAVARPRGGDALQPATA